MNHIKPTIKEFVHDLERKFNHAQALPDLAISLMGSYIADGEKLAPIVRKNIEKLLTEDGVPQEKKDTIQKLLNAL